MSDFEDIKIVGMDDEASYKSDPNSALYEIYLNLSSSAPYEWAEYFNTRWQQHFYMMKRRASVSGDKLNIYCVPDELESHINELKKVFSETNQAYKSHLSALEIDAERAKQEADKEKEKLLNIKNNISFD